MKKYVVKKRIEKKQLSLKQLLNRDNSEIRKKIFEYFTLYNAASPLRDRINRCIKFYLGEQWIDRVYVPEKNTWMTEEEYIKSKGRYPKVQNIIRSIIKNIIGQFITNDDNIVILSKKRKDNEKEMILSSAIQNVYHVNDLKNIDIRSLEYFLNAGIVCQRIRYKYIETIDESDVYVDFIPVDRIFFNLDVNDIRLNDLKVIGVLHDMDKEDVINTFASSKEEEDLLDSIIKTNVNDKFFYQKYKDVKLDDYNINDFFLPYTPDKVRIIEVWEKEYRWMYRIFDEAGEYDETVDDININEINNINKQRVIEATKTGMNIDDIPIIRYEKVKSPVWVCRFMTPEGYILKEIDSPYEHRSHPFELYMFPLIGGQIKSFTEDLIPSQKSINRNMMMLDMIISRTAKGVVMAAKQLIPEDMTPEEFINQWAREDAVILLDYSPMKANLPLPKQIAENSTYIGIYEVLQRDIQFIQDISGVFSAMQGKNTGSSTPASLYAQQTANSTLNIMDYMYAFESFLERRDKKILKLILQYYDDTKYIYITEQKNNGQYVKFNKDEIRKIDYMLVRNKSQKAPTYKIMLEEKLLNMVQSGALPFDIYLKLSTLPEAELVLKEIEKEKAQQAEMQKQMIMAQQAAQQVAQQQPNPQQVSPQEQYAEQQLQESVQQPQQKQLDISEEEKDKIANDILNESLMNGLQS